MISITLPWPQASLSPNARQHYMALARARKASAISVESRKVSGRAEAMGGRRRGGVRGHKPFILGGGAEGLA